MAKRHDAEFSEAAAALLNRITQIASDTREAADVKALAEAYALVWNNTAANSANSQF